jgi:hypothetical protein
MYGLPDSAVLGTAKRLKKVAKKSMKKSQAKAKAKAKKVVLEPQPQPQKVAGQGFVEAMIILVMPMIWLAERSNKKRAERDTLKK